MRRLVLLNVALAGCTASSGGPPATIVPPAERVVRFTPAATRYRLVSHQRGEQEFQGQVTENQQLTTTWLAVTLEPATSDTLAARFVVDSMTETGGTFTMGDVSAMRGARWTGQLLTNGHVFDLTGPNEAGLANRLANGFRQFFPRLPDQGVRAGDVWTDTVTSDVDVGGLSITVTAISHHEAEAFDSMGAAQGLLIRVASEYTMQGEGTQSGQPLTLDGGGRRHARERVGPDGRYLGKTVADTATIDVTLTSMGMSLPARRWQYDTLRVVP